MSVDVKQIGLEEKIGKVHLTLTEKKSLEGVQFDAWYTDPDFVLRELLKLGKEVAKGLRTGRYQWSKTIPNALSEVLEKKGNPFREWEDGPDGALAGLAILLSGWIANQSAAKTRDNPNDMALWWFENYVRPAIINAMEYGKNAAQVRPAAK